MTFGMVQPNPYFLQHIGTFLRKLHAKKKLLKSFWEIKHLSEKGVGGRGGGVVHIHIIYVNKVQTLLTT